MKYKVLLTKRTTIMHFFNSIKIWLLTNISGAFILTIYMAVTGKPEGEFVSEFFGLLLFMFAIGLLFSLPAIPIMLLALNLEEQISEIPVKIIILLLGSALAVYAVLVLNSYWLDMKITSDYGENLLEFTWPHLFTSVISTFFVTGKSIFNSNNHSKFNQEECHES